MHAAPSPVPTRREPGHVAATAAGLLATASGVGAGSALADIVTVTTSQQYATNMTAGDTAASFDVLFTPVQDVTELVSISSGTVYTGEGATLAIEAIASDDTTVPLFSDFLPDFFQTNPLSVITSNSFASFSAREIKGLRFSFQQFAPPPKPSLTLPVATDFQFVTVPEPAAGVLLACGVVAAFLGRVLRRQLSGSTGVAPAQEPGG